MDDPNLLDVFTNFELDDYSEAMLFLAILKILRLKDLA